MLNLRLIKPGRLIDVSRLAELQYVIEEFGQLRIGALTTHNTILRSNVIAANCPIMVEAYRHVANHSIRGRPAAWTGLWRWRYAHDAAVECASRASGRPVKYIEDRIDNITASDNHGSDRIYDVELALDANHRMTALRYKVVDDYGACFQYGLGTHGNGELPSAIRIGHLVTPSPFTEYGVEGAGEGGRMVAPPAVIAAIEDALRSLGVRIDAVPITPARLRALIREAEARKGVAR